jgi:hypothetical protein
MAGRWTRTIPVVAFVVAFVIRSSLAAGLTAAPAAPALTISPEFATSTPVFGSSSVDAAHASAATFGGTTLAVWEELDAVIGARVTAEGAVLDPTGIAVGPDGGLRPDVAAGTGQYLAVWSRSDGVQAARVASDGTVLDGTPIQVRTASVDVPEVAVAFDGTNYLVAWAEFHAATAEDLYAARVSSAGTVLDTTPIAVATGGGSARHPDVAWDGTNFMVVWDETGSLVDVKAARISSSGLLQGVFAVSTAANDQTDPAIEWGGTEYLVAWSDLRSGVADVYAGRVTAGGTVLDPNGIAVSAGTGGQNFPAVDFDGTTFLATWNDTRDAVDHDVYASRVAQDGSVLDPNGIAVDTRALRDPAPAVTWTGASHLVFFGSGTATAWGQVQARRLSLTGLKRTAPPIVVSLGANSQVAPQVASDGTDALAAWVDRRAAPGGRVGAAVYVGRISSAGEVLDGSGIRLSRTFTSSGHDGPAAVQDATLGVDVAFGATSYLVAWTEPGHLLARRVTPAGEVLDATPLRIASGTGDFRAAKVASNGLNWVVSWIWKPAGPTEVRAAVVRFDGTIARRLIVSNDVYAASTDDVGSDGAGYLVAWTSPPGATGPDMMGARLSATGQLMDPTPLLLSDADAPQEFPFVSSGVDPYLVVWEDQRDFIPNKWDAYGTRVASDATVLDPAGIGIGVSGVPDTRPVPAWDGTNWLVAWQRTSSTNQVVAARVSPGGIVLDEPTLVATSPHFGALAAGSSGAGRMAVGYSWLKPGPPENAIRMFLRFVSE